MSAVPKDCIARVATALGGKATPQQLQLIASNLTNAQQQIVNAGGSPTTALTAAAARVAQQAQLAALIAKRNAALNAIRYRALTDYVSTHWKGNEAEGLRALLTGSIRAKTGARASVALEQRMLGNTYLGSLTTELERGGLMDAFKSGSLDQDIARALWQLNSPNPNAAGLPREAVDIAKAVHRVQEAARADANKAGAWIGKLEGWVVSQSHDAWRLMKRGFDDWRATIEPRLDWARIEAERGPIADRGKWLAETYQNLASGVHLTARGASKTDGFKGPANLAKRMSEERVLHFRDADAWSEYNAEFGRGSLREAIFGGLMGSARNTGLMRVLGPNPEAMFNRLTTELRDRIRRSGDARASQKFDAAVNGWLDNRLKEVTGEVNRPVNEMLARYSANARAWQSMAKLGGAVISSVTDLATYASELSYQGRGFLSGIAEAVGGVAQGRAAGERKEILSSLGVFFDSLVGDITRQGSLDESMGGNTSRMLQTFFKYNLLNWWTESLRSSAGLSMSHYLALQAGKTFDQLAPEMQRTLALFEIDAPTWDRMRAAGVRKAADGVEFMVPDGMQPADADRLRRYVVDRADTAVLQPDADARSMLRQGTRAGTPQGELMRTIMQFKGFPVAFTRQVLGRELYGRGAEGGTVKGLTQLMVATTVLGYAAMVAKDMLKGRTPRDPRDPKTIAAAMVQGGGAGIYGDFLFGQYSRSGNRALETLAGPVLGTGAEVVNLWAKLRAGDADGGDALRLAVNNTPFANLFYTRIAADYLFLYDVQEAISPGTLRRMEQRIARDNGQTFLWSPSQDRATPITR
jgi:hypothetical protein